MDRLGVQNRTQIATWLTGHGKSTGAD